MVEPLSGLAEAPPGLLDCIFRRGKWARESLNAPASRTVEDDSAPRDESVRRYALAALDNQIRKVETAGKGTRNQTLNDAVLSLGHLVAAGALPESVVRQLMEDAARTCGLVQDDGVAAVRATIGSAIRAGMRQPANLSAIGRRSAARRRRSSSTTIGTQPSHHGDDKASRELADVGEPLTDLGNAQRFVKRHGESFRSCPVLGWLAWDGDHWSLDAAEGLIDRAVHEVVRGIKAESGDEQVLKWAHTSQGARHIGCISKLARPYLEISAASLDADPFLINVQNGTLVVRPSDHEDYVTLKPHDPRDLITKIAPVTYDPAATCPVYDQFLLDVQPDEKMRRFLHQWGGLSLIGASEQRMVVFWGKGANGKSTLLQTWAAVAGDYTKSVLIETFLDQGRARRGGEPTPDLAMLAGVRFLRTSEPERGAKLSEALIKLITGGDAMQVRHLNRDFFELRPQFKLTMSGNYRPEIRGIDEGIWRRVVLVPWTVTVAPEKRDPHLGDKLRREGPGILNRLLDGLRDWLDNRLVLPDEVTAATAAYRSDSDPLGRFLAACVVTKIGAKVQSSVLYSAFLEWTRANGESEWKQAGFSRSMAERGFRKKQSDVMWWLDLELAPRDSDGSTL